MLFRVNDVFCVLKGIGRILDASLKHQLKETIYLGSTSCCNEGYSKTVEYIFSNKSTTSNIYYPSYVFDRLCLLSLQNAVILRRLLMFSAQPKPLNNEDANYSDQTSLYSITESVPIDTSVKQSDVGFVESNPKPVLKTPSHNPLPYSDDKFKPFDAKLNLSKERRVPSSRFGRVAGFGNLVIGLGVGAATEWTKRKIGYPDNMQNNSTNRNLFLTEANLERIVNTLCKMRGAALKLGQMLSIQDESVISPQLQKVLERVRQAADFMPIGQMRKVLIEELGPDWAEKVRDFEDIPFAAASIGQVHRLTLLDGRVAAMKIQYPGVADSIDADVDNLMAVLNRFDVLPRGLYAERAVEVAKVELKAECDYIREASFAKRFTELLFDDPIFEIPAVIDELTTSRVLTAEYKEGLALDVCKSLPQNVRNWLGEQLLRLCLEELFVFRVMQTDPNWSNFLYNPETGKIVLLDFGASREYPKHFVDIYIKLIHAASQNDREGILNHSTVLGFLTGYETRVMNDAHVAAVSILGEAFASEEPFDFGRQSTTKQINQLIPVMLKYRLAPPPDESYSLHRKMSGCFLLCSKLRAVVNCRPLFYRIWNEYDFTTINDDDCKLHES